MNATTYASCHMFTICSVDKNKTAVVAVIVCFLLLNKFSFNKPSVLYDHNSEANVEILCVLLYIV